MAEGGREGEAVGKILLTRRWEVGKMTHGRPRSW